jgi:hypothetical protein
MPAQLAFERMTGAIASKSLDALPDSRQINSQKSEMTSEKSEVISHLSG